MQRVRSSAAWAPLALIAIAVWASAAQGEAYDGYTLFSPNNSTHTYLVDMSNAQVYHWTHNRVGGYSAYLLEDGSVIRPSLSDNSNLNGGGAAGLVQRVNASNTLAWQYSYSSNLVRTHHDIEPMPNGNVLLVAWERKTSSQAVQAGLDHTAEIWPDHIIEVEPAGSSGGTIVWEWHAWDHLIQDHDASKDNYGVVGDHPELLDINMGDGGGMGGGDWMHINGISYNPERDEIVISSHTLNEVYVIDHSTTTAEAAGHSGGSSGMGGDILYRWGCPANYDAPGATYFRVVHCSVWIPDGYPGAGNIMAFNNREGMSTSIVAEITPPLDGFGHYHLEEGEAFGPAAPTWTYTAAGFYSNHLGGCQRLANGNTLITESTSGYMFEVNAAGQTQWSYARGGEIARSLRYGTSYAGLVPLGLATAVPDEEESEWTGARLPHSTSPARGMTTVRYELAEAGRVQLGLYDALGREVARLIDADGTPGEGMARFDAGEFPSGVYFYRLATDGTVATRKVVLQR